MTNLWIATLGASTICYLLKLSGFLVPSTWLARPKLQRINELIPVVLLSALVAVQSLSTDSRVQVDHRIGGLIVAAIALRLKAPFPIMMLAAAIASAILYRFSL